MEAAIQAIWKHLSLSNHDKAIQRLYLKLTIKQSVVCLKHDTEAVKHGTMTATSTNGVLDL